MTTSLTRLNGLKTPSRIDDASRSRSRNVRSLSMTCGTRFNAFPAPSNCSWDHCVANMPRVIDPPDTAEDRLMRGK